MKKFYKNIPLLLLAFFIIYFTIEVYATSTGRVMRTSTFDGGCGGAGCHGTTYNANTTLSLVSGSLLVDPNTTNNYTIRVNNSTLINSGINIAVKTTITGATNIGTLQAPTGSGLQVLVDELTHTSPKTLNSGSTDFDFSWTAPDKPGKYYLRAVGLASDNKNDANNDQWNWMEPKELIVRGVELSEPKNGISACAGTDLIIKWVSAGIEKVKIELSSNSGNSWDITLKDDFIALGGSWTWSIPSNFQQGDHFRIKISDVSEPNRKSFMTGDFGIYGQFTITKHPQSADLCPGDSVKLFINTTGLGIKYQWRKNGFNLAGETDSVLILKNVNPSNAGYYGVVVTSNCYSPIVSDEANIQIRTQTSIKKQPNPIIACPGSNPSFQIEADGHYVKYQWYKNNREILNATENSLLIKNVTESDVDEYYCIVSGVCGTVKSNVVSLTLNKAPTITKQPQSKTACERSNVTFSVVATGLQNTYDWYFDDNKIPNSNNPNLELKNITYLSAGKYHCVVRNSCGDPVKSGIATLEVNPLPKITTQPQNQMLMVGDEAKFNVVAQNAVSYQWRRDKKNIKGATDSEFMIDSVTVDDNADYDCAITNECGVVYSQSVNLLVVEPEPGPRVKLASNTIDFGNIFTDNFVDSLLTEFITNVGNDTLLIDSIRIYNSIDSLVNFDLVLIDSVELAPKETLDLNIKFTPLSFGLLTAKLIVYSNSITDVPVIDVIGHGAKFDMLSNRTLIDFSDVYINEGDSVQFRLFNQSDYDIIWSETQFDCENSDDFLVKEPELPVTISAKSSQDINLLFIPSKEGEYDCFMIMKFEGTEHTIKVQLFGNGLVSHVAENNNIINKLEAYPNPSNSLVIFNFSIENNDSYTFEIIDINGNIVYSNNSNYTENENITLSWDTKDMNGNFAASGSYRAIVRSGMSSKIINFILIK